MSRDADPDPLMTYEDVATYTTYSRRFLQQAVSDKKLRWTGSASKKLFRKGEVDRWLEAMAREGQAEEPPATKSTGKARPYKPVYLKP